MAIKESGEEKKKYFADGCTCVDSGRYQEAIENFNKATELNPDGANSFYGRGEAYAYLGQHDKARDDFMKAKELGLKLNNVVVIRMAEQALKKLNKKPFLAEGQKLLARLTAPPQPSVITKFLKYIGGGNMKKIIMIIAGCAVGCMVSLPIVKSNIIPRTLERMYAFGGVWYVISKLWALVGALAILAVILILINKVVRGNSRFG